MKKHFNRNTGKLFAGMMSLSLALAVFTSTVRAQESSEEKAKSKAEGIQVEKVDGKLIVKTADGQEHVVELDKINGGNGIVVQMQKDGTEDGPLVQKSRAILIGPDGNQEVIFDSDGEGILSFEFDELPGGEGWHAMPGFEAGKTFQFSMSPSPFVIGINCDVADDTLKINLDLKAGLVVKEVFEDSAAEKAGIQVHDILVQANGQELGELEDLIKAVQESGKEETEVEISLVRKGDEVEVSVKPEKRENQFITDTEIDLSEIQDRWSERVQIQRPLPGLMVRPGSNADLAAEIAELRKMVQELRKELKDK